MVTNINEALSFQFQNLRLDTWEFTLDLLDDMLSRIFNSSRSWSQYFQKAVARG